MADYNEKNHPLHEEQGPGAAEPAIDKDDHAAQAEAPVRDLPDESNVNAAAQGIPDALPVLPELHKPLPAVFRHFNEIRPGENICQQRAVHFAVVNNEHYVRNIRPASE